MTKTHPFKRVSVIIPALNEEENIEDCILSLQSLDKMDMAVEIIVIDNGSTDATFEIASKMGVKTHLLKDVNVAALRNYGASISTGCLLAFLDADCIVAEDWLMQAIDTINKEDADAVGSVHEIPYSSNWVGRVAEKLGSKKSGVNAKYIPSGNFIIKRASFEMIEGFNGDLETSEDVDICYRLMKTGGRIFLNPKIRALHYGAPTSAKEMFLRELWHGKSVFFAFLSDIATARNFRELRSARNLPLVMFSLINLLFIIAAIIGLYGLFLNQYELLIYSVGGYLLLNLVVTLKFWKMVKSDFISIYCYMAIYGFARALSVLRSIVGSVFKKRKTA